MKSKIFFNYSRIKFIAPIIFSIIILILSIIKAIKIPFIEDYVFNSGTIAHFSAYFILSALWFLNFYKKYKTKAFFISILLAATFGVLVEFIQTFFSYRHFEIKDMIINFTGTLIIIPAYYLLTKKAKKTLNKL